MKRNFAIVVILAAVGFAMSSRSARAAAAPTNESWSSCTASLCIDAPPEGPTGLDGSGGWGWNNATNSPVTALAVGTKAALTVTVLQPGSVPPLCGSGDTLTIILTYSSQDFKLKTTDSRGVTGTDPFDRQGVETFSYTGDFLCNPDQSTAFTFTPRNATATALVTATVSVYNPNTQSVVEQASETFPVQIVPSSQQ